MLHCNNDAGHPWGQSNHVLSRRFYFYCTPYLFCSLISASVAFDRNGTVWRRSTGSGGYRSVKVVRKKAPGRGLAAWSPATTMTTEIRPVTVRTLCTNHQRPTAALTGSSRPQEANVSISLVQIIIMCNQHILLNKKSTGSSYVGDFI